MYYVTVKGKVKNRNDVSTALRSLSSSMLGIQINIYHIYIERERANDVKSVKYVKNVNNNNTKHAGDLIN